MSSERDWRLAAHYTYLDHLSPTELAWEFLRRNPDYQRDYRSIVADTPVEADYPDSLMLRWGLAFRHRSESAGE